VEHFSRISLGNQAGESDILGQSYEYLIKKFADATNKKAGEFYTPRPIVRLMVNILDPREAESIYDPACGTGGMLLEAVHHVREQLRRHATRQNRGLRLGSAHGQVNGSEDGPHGGRAATRGAVPHGS